MPPSFSNKKTVRAQWTIIFCTIFSIVAGLKRQPIVVELKNWDDVAGFGLTNVGESE
jgi:hypothetical protein